MKIDPGKLVGNNGVSPGRGDSYMTSLLKTQQGPAAPGGGAVRIPLSEMHSFRNHPFHVSDDDEMMELAESIRNKGVIQPALVRRDLMGGYEILAGHRRHRGSQLAGLEDMPAIILDVDDDDATIIMVDSNCQRKKLLPSEMANAAKMKYDAMKHQGRRSDLRGDAGERKGIEKQLKTLQRQAHLTELIPSLMGMLDVGNIPITGGYALCYIPREKQETIVEVMDQHKIKKVSPTQAEELKSIKDKAVAEYKKDVLRIFNVIEADFHVRRVSVKIPDTYLDGEALEAIGKYGQDEAFLQAVADAISNYAKSKDAGRLVG